MFYYMECKIFFTYGIREMPFHEKSAWAMILILGASAIYYVWEVYGFSMALGETAPPNSKITIVWVMFVIIGSAIAHAVLAGMTPWHADEGYDERDKLVFDKAGNWSGWVLGGGAVAGLWHFIVNNDGNLLFHIVLVSLIIAQIADYALQLWFYRKGV